jgi:hypothetical protein
MANKEKVEVEFGLKDNASKGIGKIQSAFANLKKIALGLGVAGFGVLTAIIYKSVEAWGEQEKATAKLNQALANTGNYSKKASQDLQDYAGNLQKLTTYSDDQILSGMTMIASFGIQGKELKDLTTATMDFASAKGIDLASAASLIAKSVGSETNALSRYGIEITGVAGSTDRAKSAIEGIQRIFGGQALAEANTMSGAIKKMKNAFDELGEGIGKILAPQITSIAKKIGDLAFWFDGLSQPVKITILAIAGITSGLLILVPAIFSMIAAIGVAITAVAGFGVAMNIALFGIPALIGLISAAAILLASNWGSVQKFLLNSFDYLKIGFMLFYKEIISRVEAIVNLLNKLPNVDIKLRITSEDLDKEIKKLKDKIKNRKDAPTIKIKTETTNVTNNTNVNKGGGSAKEDKDVLADRLKEYELFNAQLDGLEEENQRKRAVYLKDVLDKTSKTTEGYIDAQIKYETILTEIKKKQLSGYLNYFDDAQKYQTDIIKIGANAYLNEEKKKYIGGLKLWMAQQTAIAAGEIASIIGIPMGLLRLFGVGVAGAGVAAIDAIQLARGGSMVVSQPTMIGNNVIAGEAGKEKIDVTPIDRTATETSGPSTFILDFGDQQIEVMGRKITTNQNKNKQYRRY